MSGTKLTEKFNTIVNVSKRLFAFLIPRPVITTCDEDVCLICGNMYPKAPQKEDPFLVLDDPPLCSKCIEELSIDSDDARAKLWGSMEEYIAYCCSNADKVISQSETPPKMEVASIKVDSSESNNHDFVIPIFNEFLNHVYEYIIGQKEGVNRLCTAIYNNIENIQIMDATENARPIRNGKILLVGPAGSGKTFSMKFICEYLTIPHTTIDTSKLTASGYEGFSVDTIILSLLKEVNFDVERAERGIIFLDEGDKKEAKNTGGPDVSGQKVLDELLKILEGSDVSVKSAISGKTYVVNTNKMTIVYSGVFSEASKAREKRLGKGIGFKPNNQDLKITQYTASDFEQNGFNSQFFGRFPVIVEYNQLTKEDLESILYNKHSIFNEYVYKFSHKHNIKLSITSDAAAKLAEYCIQLGTGGRALDSKMFVILLNALSKIYISPENTYKSCVITADSITTDQAILT